MVELHDTLILDTRARRLRTGELAASVRCARTGVQDYLGSEVGKPELARVTVYRPESEVMKRDSLATFAGVPVTIEHPKEAVTTDNWKRYAVGEAGDEVVRDGEFIRVPILVRDEQAIREIQDGKREISMGYCCSLEFVDGVTPDGKSYQAIQRDIKINHLAVVDQARGGSALTIEDERTYSGDDNAHKNDAARRETSNSGGSHVATKTITFDGLPLEVTDAAEAAITKLQGQITTLTAAKDAAETKVGELTATVSTKDGEIAALGQKLKDAELKPEQLEKLVKDRAELIGQAKAIEPSLVTDGKSDAEIRKAVVAAKLGDAAQSLDDAAIGGAFAVLAKDVKIDPVRTAISSGLNVADAATKEAEALLAANDHNSWRKQA